MSAATLIILGETARMMMKCRQELTQLGTDPQLIDNAETSLWIGVKHGFIPKTYWGGQKLVTFYYPVPLLPYDPFTCAATLWFSVGTDMQTGAHFLQYQEKHNSSARNDYQPKWANWYFGTALPDYIRVVENTIQTVGLHHPLCNWDETIQKQVRMDIKTAYAQEATKGNVCPNTGMIYSMGTPQKNTVTHIGAANNPAPIIASNNISGEIILDAKLSAPTELCRTCYGEFPLEQLTVGYGGRMFCPECK